LHKENGSNSGHLILFYFFISVFYFILMWH